MPVPLRISSPIRDDTGAYFIDRNGKHFEPLLEYLRTGVLEIPATLSRTALAREADYYMVQWQFADLSTDLKPLCLCDRLI